MDHIMYLPGTASKRKNYFFSSFSASAAFFNRTPTNRLFILSTRNFAYALKFFISSVTLTSSRDGFSLVIGKYFPCTWVAVASSSGLESPAYTWICKAYYIHPKNWTVIKEFWNPKIQKAFKARILPLTCEQFLRRQPTSLCMFSVSEH